MDGKISRGTQEELLDAIRLRYRNASKPGKGRILDEVIALMACHRKHAIRLLRQAVQTTKTTTRGRDPIYDEAVREAVTILWEAADRICGKRLKALLPTLLESMESHGHLKPDSTVRERLLSISAATIDRILAPVRSKSQTRKKRRRKTKPSKQVPTRTFADWDDLPPGYLEIDFVVHCGGSMAGTYIHSLVATDVWTGWTEAIPLLAREQTLVTEGLTILRQQFPIPIMGINSDNDSAFINDTLVTYCGQQKIEFTRSRAYRKNDQAWIEQKNGAIVRKFVGYDRFSGIVAGQAMSQLYQAIRLYVNFFQPSFKLQEKTRTGSKVKKTYFPPATPCDRMLAHENILESSKESLRQQRSKLDPVELLHRIRRTQEALANLANSQSGEPVGESLAEFLEQLPRLWKSGESRPTHRKPDSETRNYRTRKDPFEAAWPEILAWLQKEPDKTAKDLFKKLQDKHPDQYTNGQLRTLQRRVRTWRHVMAKKLVFSQSSESGAERNIPAPVATKEPVESQQASSDF